MHKNKRFAKPKACGFINGDGVSIQQHWIKPRWQTTIVRKAVGNAGWKKWYLFVGFEAMWA